jgi:hypothetical protein
VLALVEAVEGLRMAVQLWHSVGWVGHRVEAVEGNMKLLLWL